MTGKFQVVLKPEAERDITEAFDWYEGRRPGLGDEFLLAVEAALGAISREPEAYSRVLREIRRALLRRFPYGLFFVFEGERISVLAVLHARRDPAVWHSRS